MNLRKILIIFTIFVLNLITFADFSLLGGAGLNWSQLNYTGSYESMEPTFPDTLGWKIGFNAGFYLELDFDDEKSIVTGFTFESRGEKVISSDIKAGAGTDDEPYEVLRGRFETYYTIPLFMRFNTQESDNESYFGIGLEMGFLNSTSSFYELDGITDTSQLSNPPVLEEMNKLDLGLYLEIGYEFPVFEEHLIHLSASYTYGFFNRELEQESSSNDGGIKNTNLKLMVAYKFDLLEFEFGSDDGSNYKYESDDLDNSDDDYINEFENEDIDDDFKEANEKIKE